MSIDLNAFIPGSESWNMNSKNEPNNNFTDKELMLIGEKLDNEFKYLTMCSDVLFERAGTFNNLINYRKNHGSFDKLGEVINVKAYVGNENLDMVLKVGNESIAEGAKKIWDQIVKWWNQFVNWVKGFFNNTKKKAVDLNNLIDKIDGAKFPIKFNGILFDSELDKEFQELKSNSYAWAEQLSKMRDDPEAAKAFVNEYKGKLSANDVKFKTADQEWNDAKSIKEYVNNVSQYMSLFAGFCSDIDHALKGFQNVTLFNSKEMADAVTGFLKKVQGVNSYVAKKCNATLDAVARAIK